MSPEELSSMAGILLSLGFSYIPGLHDRFDSLQPTHKRLVMLSLLAVCALSVFGLSCTGWGADLINNPAGNPLSCDRGGGILLLRSLVMAIIANQAAFLISPRRACSVANNLEKPN